jgi:GH24 family phage-related lysozyme (muramidase)
MPSLFCEWWERWNSPYINHFISADTIIPDQTNPQSWNRYAYVSNNPVNATDPTGHQCVGEPEECLEDDGTPINGAGGLGSGSQSDDPIDIWDTESTNVSADIVDNIVDWEGYEYYPYEDSAGNCTVGIGHKLHDSACTIVELNTFYSDKQINEWFSVDLADAESDVRAMFQTLDNEYRPGLPPGNPVPINQAQFDALVSFTFNAGAGNLTSLVRASARPQMGTSNGTFDKQVFSSLMLGTYSQGGEGLLPRRQAEVTLFIYGLYP